MVIAMVDMLHKPCIHIYLQHPQNVRVCTSSGTYVRNLLRAIMSNL